MYLVCNIFDQILQPHQRLLPIQRLKNLQYPRYKLQHIPRQQQQQQAYQLQQRTWQVQLEVQ
jgi:hypothetical protein